MTEEQAKLSADDKHRMNFMGLVLFLRQMATQLISLDQIDEARGLIDSVESLQMKTKGNIGEEEERLLESVLFELRMAAVQGPKDPPPSEPEAQEGD